MTLKPRAAGKRREGGRGRGEGRGGKAASEGRDPSGVGTGAGKWSKIVQRRGVASTLGSRIVLGSSVMVLGLFGQELAHEEEVAEPAARTGAQVGRAGAGLMRIVD